MVISCVAIGWLVIPLAWLIPMTIMTYGVYKGKRKNTIALGVCSIIFASLVSGICLLVSTKEDE
jgi:hypothetical protein